MPDEPDAAPTKAETTPTGGLTAEEREWYEGLCSDEEFDRICAIPLAERTPEEQRKWSDHNWWAFS